MNVFYQQVGLILALFLIAFPVSPISGEPPLSGSIFMDPDIITAEDPSLFESASFAGEGQRLVFDRRVNAWVTLEMYLFDLRFLSGQLVEARVNREFGSVEAARERAERYGLTVGRIPLELMREVESITIHDGIEPFGGGNQNLLIHDGQGLLYQADGILAEVFVHEASHTSLDATHAASEGWLAAQAADPDFVSDYAASFPEREDVAETFLAYLAVTLRADRLPATLVEEIQQAVPARIDYLRAQPLLLYPMAPLEKAPTLSLRPTADSSWELAWASQTFQLFKVEESAFLEDWSEVEGNPVVVEGENRVPLVFGESTPDRFYRLSEKLDRASADL